MKALTAWSPAPNLNVSAAEREGSGWLVTGHSQERVLSDLRRAIEFAA